MFSDLGQLVLGVMMEDWIADWYFQHNYHSFIYMHICIFLLNIYINDRTALSILRILLSTIFLMVRFFFCFFL